MDTWLPFVVVGITAGAVYGLAGVGLVLTYRTSGVFNFAHGALATAGAYLFYELWVKSDIPWPIAALIVIAVVGIAFGFVLEQFSRRLAKAPASVIVVATVGLLLIIQGTAAKRYGSETITIEPFLPTDTFDISVNVGYDQLIIVLVGIAIAAGLAVVLTRTRVGIAMRGVVDDSDLMELTGLDGATVRRAAWMIGGSVAVISGMLLAPIVGLDPIRLTYLVVQAFGAAAIGRFRSLPWTFGGGLIIGVAAAFGQKFEAENSALLGLPASVPFLALFAVLIVVGKRGLPTPAPVRRVQPEQFTKLPLPVRVAAGMAVGALVIALPSLVDARLPVYTNAVGLAIMFLSLGLLVKMSAQVSLCHAAFVAVGAVAFSRLSTEANLPWLLALIGAGLITVPLGILVALPAIRLSGIYLALATFAFGLLMENLIYRKDFMFPQGGTRDAPRPELPGSGPASDKEYFYIAVGVLVAVILAVIVLQRSRLGRLLRAFADSPLALSTYGTGTTTTLVLLFSISAFFAGVAGGVIAVGNGAAGPGGLGSLQSLLWVAIIAITGNNLIRSSILAALLLAVLPSYLTKLDADYQAIAFGVAAVIASLIAANGFDPVTWIRDSLAGSPRVGSTGPIPTRGRDRGWRRASSTRSRALTTNAAATASDESTELALSGGKR
ncbi:MAG: branched-chain amino acid ABC transporter permease [Sporichthyaceae bacterium]